MFSHDELSYRYCGSTVEVQAKLSRFDEGSQPISVVTRAPLFSSSLKRPRNPVGAHRACIDPGVIARAQHFGVAVFR